LNSLKKVLALLLVLGLIAAACGDDAEDTTTTAATQAPTTTAAGIDFLACQVTDTGGIDDRSFNATAWKGMQDAQAELGIEIEYVESQVETDYEPNIQSMIDKGCDLIVSVGFLLGNATKAKAEANPDQAFEILDYPSEAPNIAGALFKTDEAAFLAGYVAASVTQTGKVATYGGIQIPGAVTAFMDGFAWGVEYYNEQKGTSVEVLGWDPDAQTGVFTGDFEDQTKGRNVAQQFIDEGADIILPVAGPVGLGSAALAQEVGDVYIIGVDADWYFSADQYKEVILTSVLKGLDVAVFNVIEDAIAGNFAGGDILFTLADEGVGLAPFHDNDGMVSADTKAELDAIRAGIADGSITVGG
jgi:basic membrane protein A